MSFSDLLHSISRSIHVAANDIILFFFMATMIVLKSTGWVFCRLSLKLVWSYVFLMIRLGLCVFGKHTTNAKCPSHHITSGGKWYPHAITGEVNPDHLVKVVCARFLHCKVSIFPFHSLFFTSESLGPAWKGREVYLHIVFGILSLGRFISYPPFIYGDFSLVDNSNSLNLWEVKLKL